MKKTNLCLAAVFAALFVILLVFVRSADVAAIGPAGTSVGLSGLNRAAHERIGVDLRLYDVTQLLGYLAIALALAFACVGLVQLIRRRSLRRVDRPILALGGLYAALAVLYVFFEKVIVNFRPILMPDAAEPEASFPSSHTMLACVIFGSAALLAGRYLRRVALKRTLVVLCWLLAAATVILRLASGVHWLTDIVAGALLSGALLSLYAAVSAAPNHDREEERNA